MTEPTGAAYHATRAQELLGRAEGANRTDPRRDQDARLAQTHALLGIYGLLEQLAAPRVIVGAEVVSPTNPLLGHLTIPIVDGPE